VLTLAQVEEATGGTCIGSLAQPLTSVSTDSRTLTPGALFVALTGPHFDGHRFLEAAYERGAAAVMVNSTALLPAGLPAVVVADTLEALQRLATWHRQRLPLTVVGLTGSAGKTTTKELVASILSEHAATVATQGNLNNHIGVPLTLLRFQPDHSLAVVEMGCSDFGEIALLASLARPSVGLVTNVGPAHLEKLGDLEGVARAKGELFAALPAEGWAVVNVDDERVRAMASSARRLTYGRGTEAELRLVRRRAQGLGQELELALGGEVIRPRLALLGDHNAFNALAAAAVAVALEIPSETIARGLERTQAVAGRLQVRTTPQGLTIIDDSYNANPDSMKVALKVLAEQTSPPARGHALLGEMLELGQGARALHAAVARHALSLGVDSFVAVGPAAGWYAEGLDERCLSAGQAATPAEGAQLVAQRARPGDWVLVKGSRGARMEQAVAALCDGSATGTLEEDE
jgi:UDP-N-acetylmuramoyl-tripeptide--D-alanyl-D-alanine ligase